MNIDHPYILDVVKKYYLLSKQNKIVELCWIPSHIGICGNTKADKAAKDALKYIYDIALFRIPYTDLKYLIRIYMYVNSLWQNHLDFHDTNKLYLM
jgi:hypothetical protein